MCEINPRHTMIFRMEFFTSDPNISAENFQQLVAGMALGMEMKANESGMIRCHIHEMREQRESRPRDEFKRGDPGHPDNEMGM